MKNLTKTFLLILIFAVSSIFAQEQLPWLVISQQKVLPKNVEKINELLKRAAPILNEFQKEGKIIAWGQFNHAWGDDWNVNMYYVTKDRDSFFKFIDEFIKSLNEKFPGEENDPRQYFEEHKDNMYQFRQIHVNNKLIPGFNVINQQIVAMTDVPKVNELVKKLTPILNKYLDEGKISGWGQFDHTWGDEWNVNFYFFAKDHASFINFWSEASKEINEKNPGLLGELRSYYKAHKDNMYHVIQISRPLDNINK